MIEELGERSRSASEFIYTINKREPSMEPWGTPDLTGKGEEEWPLRTTVWERLEPEVALSS